MIACRQNMVKQTHIASLWGLNKCQCVNLQQGSHFLSKETGYSTKIAGLHPLKNWGFDGDLFFSPSCSKWLIRQSSCMKIILVRTYLCKMENWADTLGGQTLQCTMFPYLARSISARSKMLYLDLFAIHWVLHLPKCRSTLSPTYASCAHDSNWSSIAVAPLFLPSCQASLQRRPETNRPTSEVMSNEFNLHVKCVNCVSQPSDVFALQGHLLWTCNWSFQLEADRCCKCQPHRAWPLLFSLCFEQFALKQAFWPTVHAYSENRNTSHIVLN